MRQQLVLLASPPAYLACPGADSPIGLGVEVSTKSGSWRTLRHPQG